MGKAATALDQAAFRGREDSGSDDATATWLANKDTNWTQARDTEFRVRYLIQESGGVEAADFTGTAQYAVDTGGGYGSYANVGAATPVQYADGTRTDGDDCDSSHLSGSGTQDTTNAGYSEDGTAGGADCDIPANGHTEFEYVLLLDSGQLDQGDKVKVRVTGTSLTSWSSEPEITAGTTPNVTVPVATLTAQAVQPAVTLVTNNIIGVATLSAQAVQPGVTVSAGAVVPVATLTATATAPALSGVTGDALVDVATQAVQAIQPALAGVSGDANVAVAALVVQSVQNALAAVVGDANVAVATQSASATAPALAAIIGDALVAVATQSAAATAPAVTVDVGGGSVDVTVPVATLSASATAPAIVVVGDANVTVAVLSVTASAPGVTVITAEVAQLPLLFSQMAVTRTLDRSLDAETTTTIPANRVRTITHSLDRSSGWDGALERVTSLDFALERK